MIKKEAVFIFLSMFLLIGAGCEKGSTEICPNAIELDGELVCDTPVEDCTESIFVDGKEICVVEEVVE